MPLPAYLFAKILTAIASLIITAILLTPGVTGWCWHLRRRVVGLLGITSPARFPSQPWAVSGAVACERRTRNRQPDLSAHVVCLGPVDADRSSAALAARDRSFPADLSLRTAGAACRGICAARLDASALGSAGRLHLYPDVTQLGGLQPRAGTRVSTFKTIRHAMQAGRSALRLSGLRIKPWAGLPKIRSGECTSPPATGSAGSGSSTRLFSSSSPSIATTCATG